MIDEKKLIERLEDYKNNDWNKQLYTSLPTVVDDCIDFVENQPKIGEWILCSERLPEVEQDALLSLRSLDVYTGFRANTDGMFYVEGEGYVEYENVLAWQPLLAPYEVKYDE